MRSAVPSIPDRDLFSEAAELLGREVDSIFPLDGGANNRVFRLQSGGRDYALKVYACGTDDTRDRIGVETRALRFLESQGLDCVPRCVASDHRNKIAIHSWLSGQPIASATLADIEAALCFVQDLRDVSRVRAATKIPAASEACLSPGELVRQVRERLERLLEISEHYADLREFLLKDLGPILDQATDHARQMLRVDGSEFNALLQESSQTLSPSDFGFHNARRIGNKLVVFYDFEYFGWDDPVRLAADFLLHPGMMLGNNERRRFASGVCEIFSQDALFVHRLRAYFPLICLRWCLIILNEFLPNIWSRRVFALANGADSSNVHSRQLIKAKNMLAIAVGSLKNFPYDV